MVPSGGYHFQTIDDPNGVSVNQAQGINSRGEIVGSYRDGSGAKAAHGYLRSGGGAYTTLDDPNAAGFTIASGINARGQIVGSYLDASGFHGFLLSGGKYTNIDVPNAGITFATGINDAGSIVGSYADSSGDHGFLLSGGKYITLDDPNGSTTAAGINDHGQIVGSYVDASGKPQGFLLSGGKYTTLDDPNALWTAPSGINDRGQIVGAYFAADFSGEHGFLLSGGQYTTLDDPTALGQNVAYSINDSGKIVGSYVDTSFNYDGYLATKAHDDEGEGDDAPARTSMNDAGASGGSAQVLLPAALTNSTLTANQLIHVAGGSGADRNDGLSGISSGPTWDLATVPSTLVGSGDNAAGRVPVVSTSGTDTGLPGNDVFARNDDAFRVALFR
jgi:hypothetical protein